MESDYFSEAPVKFYQATLRHIPEAVQVGRQILACGSLLRNGQTQVGEPKIGEHAQ
jgi:hypothetical protein